MISWKNTSLGFFKKFFIPLSLFLWICLFANYNFAKGFDFTDSTLSYHFSLRVLNGDIPFKDFHTTVLPFTYYVGAFFHYLFGKSLLVNNYLGLLCVFIQTFLIYLILKKFIKNKSNSFFITIFLVSIFGDINGSIYFSYKPLAYTLSLLSVYLSLISFRRTNFVYLLGITSCLTFFTLQSMGLALLASYLFFILILFIYKTYDRKFILSLFIKYILGFLLILIPFIIYYSNQGVLEEIRYIITTSSERKGIDSYTILNFFDTLLPAHNSLTLIATIIFSISFLLCLLKLSKKKLLNLYLIASVWAIIGFYSGGIVKHITFIVFYESPKILILVILFYYIFYEKNKFNESNLLLTIMLAGLIFVHELSWPGPGYKLPVLTSIYFLIIPYFNIGKAPQSENINRFLYFRLFFILANTFLLTWNLFNPVRNIYRDFEPEDKITLNPYLKAREISSAHKKAIFEFKKNYSKYCRNENSFIFPWAPILYEIIGTRNATKFDMPNHDWITLKESKQIISSIKKKPPCYLILEESALYNKRRLFFPAKGLKQISKFLRDEFLVDYEYISQVSTFKRNWMIFYKKYK